MDTDDLYFDNQDELDLESQLLGEEGGSHGGEPDQGRGDLNIALKKEREEKRQLKEQLAQRDKDLERERTFNQVLGQRREAPRVDPAMARQELSDALTEKPDEVFNQRDQALLSQVQRMNAPVYVKAAKSDVAEHPEYGDLYKTRPNFKKTVDAYIQNAVNTYGTVDPAALEETLTYLGGIASESGGGKASNDAAKAKLTSVADKGSSSGRRSAEQILEEKLALAEKGRNGNRKALYEYSAWSKTAEGKAVLNWKLKQQQG